MATTKQIIYRLITLNETINNFDSDIMQRLPYDFKYDATDIIIQAVDRLSEQQFDIEKVTYDYYCDDGR